MLTANEVFEKLRDAALASTDADERPLQIDYEAMGKKINLALGGRKIAYLYINDGIPHGYEEQGRFNALAISQGNVLFDMVIGDDYFRYDIFSTKDLEKVQIQYGVWKDDDSVGASGDRLKAEEKPFLAFTMMHGDEEHKFIALNDPDREIALLDLVSAISIARHPE